MHILDIPPELLLNVASRLSQADLLNITLTHRRLKDITEPELFREYTNIRLVTEDHSGDGRPFIPFIRRLIDRPELAKHVRFVDLRPYSHLYQLSPTQGDVRESSPLVECTAADYEWLTQAALASGTITKALRYERRSSILQKLISSSYFKGWSDHLYDGKKHTRDVPYDTRFCKLLRTGIEEPIVVLLLALLPNLRRLNLLGAPHEPYSLEFRSSHAFKALTHFATCATWEFETPYPLGFFSRLLSGGNLQCLDANSAACAWQQECDPEASIPNQLALAPGSTKITHLTLRSCVLTKSHMENLLCVQPYKLAA